MLYQKVDLPKNEKIRYFIWKAIWLIILGALAYGLYRLLIMDYGDMFSILIWIIKILAGFILFAVVFIFVMLVLNNPIGGS